MFALKFNDLLINPTVHLIWGIVGLASSVYYIHAYVKWMKAETGFICIKVALMLGGFLIVGTMAGFILPLFLYMDHLFEKSNRDNSIYSRKR